MPILSGLALQIWASLAIFEMSLQSAPVMPVNYDSRGLFDRFKRC
jgi:hypothetical protein